MWTFCTTEVQGVQGVTVKANEVTLNLEGAKEGAEELELKWRAPTRSSRRSCRYKDAGHSRMHTCTEVGVGELLMHTRAPKQERACPQPVWKSPVRVSWELSADKFPSCISCFACVSSGAQMPSSPGKTLCAHSFISPFPFCSAQNGRTVYSCTHVHAHVYSCTHVYVYTVRLERFTPLSQRLCTFDSH